MVNNKTFELRPISELFSIVKGDLKKFDAEGLIDEGNLIKTILYANDRLGLTVREIHEVATPVEDFKAPLPHDFEKLFYVAALSCSGTQISSGNRNPFENHFDNDVIQDVCLNRDQIGCVDNYQVTINRTSTPITYHYGQWTQLNVSKSSSIHTDCPNLKRNGKYEIEVRDDYIHTPFRTGQLYMMYVGMMKDEEGNILFPFHPLITPYYEWLLKEKIISDALFNSDGQGLGDLFKLAQNERVKAWLDAFNITTDKGYGEYVDYQKRKELTFYNQYFKYFNY